MCQREVWLCEDSHNQLLIITHVCILHSQREKLHFELSWGRFLRWHNINVLCISPIASYISLCGFRISVVDFTLSKVLSNSLTHLLSELFDCHGSFIF